jgi:hypothetical protein
MSAGPGRRSARNYRPSCRLAPIASARFRFHQGDETIAVWSALDALVLIATVLVLTARWLPNFSPHCHHLPGRGGAKAAVRFVHEHLAANAFVFRTDVESYYANIDHDILLAMLERHVPDAIQELILKPRRTGRGRIGLLNFRTARDGRRGFPLFLSIRPRFPG